MCVGEFVCECVLVSLSGQLKNHGSKVYACPKLEQDLPRLPSRCKSRSSIVIGVSRIFVQNTSVLCVCVCVCVRGCQISLSHARAIFKKLISS